MNSISLIGRTTHDAELKFYGEGKQLANFTLAVTRRDAAKTTDFIDCVAFGKLADVCDKWVKKGDRVGVVGELNIDAYEKDGQKHRRAKVVVKDLDLFFEKKATAEKASEVEQGDYAELEDDEDVPF